MKLLDLFSGIGGFSLAASWVWGDDLEIVGFCEIDPFCQKVLKKHWPEVKIYDDIKELKGGEFGAVDLITGGFPCQPYSCAGKRKGKNDDRALWPQMFRVIAEVRPHWIIGENVRGFVNMGLDDCISDLEGEDYEVQAFIIPACAVNAPHRRDRVWIIANRTESGLSQSRLAGIGKFQEETGAGIHDRPEQPDCHASNTQKPRLERRIRTGTGCTNGRDTKYAFSNLWQNKVEPWDRPWIEVATRLCTVDDGFPGRLVQPKGWRVNALKAAGNSIVPQVAAVIMQAIKQTDSEEVGDERSMCETDNHSHCI